MAPDDGRHQLAAKTAETAIWTFLHHYCKNCTPPLGGAVRAVAAVQVVAAIKGNQAKKRREARPGERHTEPTGEAPTLSIRKSAPKRGCLENGQPARRCSFSPTRHFPTKATQSLREHEAMVCRCKEKGTAMPPPHTLAPLVTGSNGAENEKPGECY